MFIIKRKKALYYFAFPNLFRVCKSFLKTAVENRLFSLYFQTPNKHITLAYSISNTVTIYINKVFIMILIIYNSNIYKMIKLFIKRAVMFINKNALKTKKISTVSTP